MRGFAFVSSKAVLVRKNGRTFGAHRPKAPSGRELPTESGEGERVTIELVQIQSYAGSFRHAIACHLPPGGRLCCRPIVHRKGVIHYTLPCKACEKEYEQIVRTPFILGRGLVSRRLFNFCVCNGASKPPPTMDIQVSNDPHDA